MSHSMQSHIKQMHYVNELARLKRENEQREKENAEAINELKENIVLRKKKRGKKSKAKRK
jgi:hypothetical protein